MLGWFSAARMPASRSKRASRSPSWAKASGSTFMAADQADDLVEQSKASTGLQRHKGGTVSRIVYPELLHRPTGDDSDTSND